jgi:tripartite-type tricarboxylate transporter receptor subunit TctC
MLKFFTRALLLGLATLATGVSSFADTYPDRPIRFVVPWPPAGGADVVARLLSVPLAEELGKPVIIENRPGAGGNIGSAVAARAAADGYTISFAYSGTHSINRHLYKDMPFEEKDFTPVIFVSSVPQLMVVNANLPFKSVRDVIAGAKASPGKLTYGSSGNGAINHLAGQLFADMSGIQLEHIPYKGGAAAASALLSGEIDMVLGEPSVLLPHVASGKFRALAVTSDKRSATMPELPTIAEAGVPGYAVTSWNGILAPANTPEFAIKRLNAALNKILANPEMRARLLKMGYEPVGGPPEIFSKHIEAETLKWGPVIKKSGLQIN